MLVITTAVYLSYGRPIPPDITNWKSVERIVDSAADQDDVQIQSKDGYDLYCLKNGKPLTGWIKGNKFSVSEVYKGNTKFGTDEVNLLHVTNGKLDKEWNFYAGNTVHPEYEITYNTSTKSEKHGVHGVMSFRRWMPNGNPCPKSQINNGEGTTFEYDIVVYYRMGGDVSGNEVTPQPTKLVKYADGKIASVEKLETDVSRKIAEQEMKNRENAENKGRTYEEIALRKNMQKAYPSISFEDLKTVVDDMFGETSNTKEERQRNHILDDIFMFAESTNTGKLEALENYKHWRETYSTELFDLSPDRFDFQCAKMVADNLTKSMVAADDGKKASASLRKSDVKGFEEKNDKSDFDIMNAICSYYLASICKGYQEYKSLRDSVSKGNMTEQTMLDAKNILKRFEYAKSRAQRNEIEMEAKSCLYKSRLELKNENGTHESDKQEIVTDASDTNATDSPPKTDEANSSVDPVEALPALQVFKSGTLDEAKESIQLLDEQLKNDPENARVKLVKSTIMDVFRAEVSLIAALTGQKDAEKQYQIKMQNLQIASRPSPLTGKVNTAEVERIRRDANAIKASSATGINAAKIDLRKSLDSAKRVVPAPDKDGLSRIWSQIERRHNL